MARWGLGVKYPTKVSAIGGHFMFDDDQETPNTLTATFEFDDGGKKKMMVFEVRHWITNHEAGIGEAASRATPSAPCSTGRRATSRSGTKTTAGTQSFLGREQTARARSGPPTLGNHWANFIDAVRSRKHVGPERADRRRRHLHDAGAPGEHFVSARPDAAFRRGELLLHRRCGSQRMFRREYRKPFVVPDKV